MEIDVRIKIDLPNEVADTLGIDEDSKLIDEIKTLVANNYKEIVLTGVNTAGYNDSENNFYTLLKEINKLEGNFRVRISSVEPFQISDEIIQLICKNKNRFAQH